MSKSDVGILNCVVALFAFIGACVAAALTSLWLMIVLQIIAIVNVAMAYFNFKPSPTGAKDK